jgi:hypothetical protein
VACGKSNETKEKNKRKRKETGGEAREGKK